MPRPYARSARWSLLGIPARSPLATDQPLQVASLREVRRHRMICRLAKPCFDEHVRPGIARRAGHDLLKQLWAHSAGAREGHQTAAGPQQLECQQVDVL